MIGFFTAAESRGAEKDNLFLDLFTAEPRQRFKKLRHNPDGAPFGAVEKCWILVGQRCALQQGRPSVSGNDCRRHSLRWTWNTHAGQFSSGRTFRIFFFTHNSTIPVTNGVLKRNPIFNRPRPDTIPRTAPRVAKSPSAGNNWKIGFWSQSMRAPGKTMSTCGKYMTMCPSHGRKNTNNPMKMR